MFISIRERVSQKCILRWKSQKYAKFCDFSEFLDFFAKHALCAPRQSVHNRKCLQTDSQCDFERGGNEKRFFCFASHLRGAKKYFLKNIFGAQSNFILKIQEIRSWLKTLFNQWYFRSFGGPDLHKSDFSVKSALFAQKCTFTENMTFLLKINILR